MKIVIGRLLQFFYYFYQMRLLFLCFSILLSASSFSIAQEMLEFGDTPTTTKSPKYKPKHKDYKSKHKIQWVKSNGKNLLIGNPCMDELIHDMGFVYLVQPKGQAPNESGFQRNVHNLFAKLRITFRNGPFWKFKLKRWRKRCGAETGDFVG